MDKTDLNIKPYKNTRSRTFTSKRNYKIKRGANTTTTHLKNKVLNFCRQIWFDHGPVFDEQNFCVNFCRGIFDASFGLAFFLLLGHGLLQISVQTFEKWRHLFVDISTLNGEVSQ